MTSPQKAKIDNFFNRFESIFKYLYLTLTLLSFNVLFANQFPLKIFSLFVVALGSIIVFYRLLNAKKYIKFYGFPLLIVFALSYAISSIANIKYGFIENLQALVWMVFHFAILYACDTTKPAEKETKLFLGITKYFMFYVFISNIISIGMLLVGFGRVAHLSFNNNIMGFVWGRLWGTYTDPNIGSVLCIASIYISIYFFIKTTIKLKKILMILNIILSLCYIAFSDSRTGIVCLLFSSFVCSYIYFVHTKKCNSKKFLKQFTSLVFAAIIAFTSSMSISAIKNGYNAVINISNNWISDLSDSSNSNDKLSSEFPDSSDSSESSKDPEESKGDEGSNNTVGRTGNELENDISNRRFSLWSSGIEIWEKSPVFGTSHRNLVSFALDNTPKTYLVNNDRNSYFNTTHNSYIDVLVSQGLFGAIIFVLVFVIIIILIFKKIIFSNESTYLTPENLLLIGLILTFATSAIFVLEIVYINTAGAFIFWLSLGRLVSNIKETKNG